MEVNDILKKGLLVKKGAEAEIFKGNYLDFDVVIKHRIPKPYRHEVIDQKIRTQRISSEAKVLMSARRAFVNVPYLFGIDFENYSLIIQNIKGESLADYLTSLDKPERSLLILEKVGIETARLHLAGIVHGDLSPFNILLHAQQVFLIDFGLSEFAVSYEKRATDFYTFAQTLEGLDVLQPQFLFESFKKGYGASTKDIEVVIKQMERIKTRGRYVPRKDRKIGRKSTHA
ncbi:MAG: KEOPS complex kinase/ATPase Bud32 [Promethearchaeota archaeon]